MQDIIGDFFLNKIKKGEKFCNRFFIVYYIDLLI